MPHQPPLAARILVPLLSILNRLLPEFGKEILQDPRIRERLIAAIDTTLINEYPVARALPVSLRRNCSAIGCFAELPQACAEV